MTEPWPEPPTNVRIEFADGREPIPVELRYDGIDDGGYYSWTAVIDPSVADIKTEWRLCLDAMPGSTRIELDIAY